MMKMLSLDSVLVQLLKLLGFSSKYAQVSGGEIHYFEKRAKNPKGVVVLIHGIGATSVHYWKVMNLLYHSGYTIYAPDLPGHGSSPDPVDTVTPELFYKMFVDWANQVVKQPYILIGNSLGGALSVRLSLEEPGQVEKMILISPAGGFCDEVEWNQFKESIEFRSILDSVRFVSRIFHKRPIYTPLIYYPFYRKMLNRSVKELLQNSSFQDFKLLDFETAVQKMPPTLFIWGKSEKVFPSHHLDRFKSVFPAQVVFEEPEGVGHCPHLDNAGWLFRRVSAFIG